MAALPIAGSTSNAPARRWRWIPVSLRMFLAIIVLVGVGGVSIAIPVFRQDQAIQSVERSGGYVETRGNPSQPSWLLAWVGDRWTRAICPVSIVSCGDKFSDADMAQLPSPESIERLFLGKGKITDAGLVHLESLTSLECLGLQGSQVTDAGLAHIR